jgi:hypothetical protein
MLFSLGPSQRESGVIVTVSVSAVAIFFFKRVSVFL